MDPTLLSVGQHLLTLFLPPPRHVTCKMILSTAYIAAGILGTPGTISCGNVLVVMTGIIGRTSAMMEEACAALKATSTNQT